MNALLGELGGAVSDEHYDHDRSLEVTVYIYYIHKIKWVTEVGNI